MPGANLPTDPKRLDGWTCSPGLGASGLGKLTLTTGAEKLPLDLANHFEERFHKKVFEGYGLTETAPVMIRRKLLSCSGSALRK